MKGLYFIGGLAIGIAGGIFIGMKINEKKLQADFDQERESLRDYYKKRIDEAVKVNDCINKPPIDDVVNKSLDDMVQQYKSKNETRDDIEKEPLQDMTLDLISSDEYDDLDYNKMTLIFEDGMLMDYDNGDDPDVIDDDRLTNFVTDACGLTDDTTIYVRDDARRCDYEIILNDSPMED